MVVVVTGVERGCGEVGGDGRVVTSDGVWRMTGRGVSLSVAQWTVRW